MLDFQSVEPGLVIELDYPRPWWYPRVMTRPLRIEYANPSFHVTSRGNARRTIVRDIVDRDKWVELLRRSVEEQGWRLFAFALMTNHFRLFVQYRRCERDPGWTRWWMPRRDTLESIPKRGLKAGDATGWAARWPRILPEVCATPPGGRSPRTWATVTPAAYRRPVAA